MHERVNRDRAEAAQEVILSRKTKNITYLNLYFNNLAIVKAASLNHLRLNLDARLAFNDHINE